MPVHDAIRAALQTTGPGSCRVSVAGELDVATAPEVRTALRTALADHRRVVIDLSRTPLRFCDCSGLTMLMATARTARHHGVDLRLRAVPRSLARIMRLTGTHGLFTADPAPPPGGGSPPTVRGPNLTVRHGHISKQGSNWLRVKCASGSSADGGSPAARTRASSRVPRHAARSGQGSRSMGVSQPKPRVKARHREVSRTSRRVGRIGSPGRMVTR
jgi:anti-anti-sigma factor